MQVRKLTIEGAYVFTPPTFEDDRGRFASPYERAPFEAVVGAPLFEVAQSSVSRSRRGVVRGVHYRATPPGAAKYVTCVNGSALDVVVDTRVGSSTFGRWESTVLDQRTCRAVYLPIGVGHLFVALTDDTVMAYLLSQPYVAEQELAVHPLDPSLALPIPGDIVPVLSDRDCRAPTLAQARAAGLLPHVADCRV